MSDEDIRGNYEGFEWCLRETGADHVIDNSQLTLEQTVDAIEAELSRFP